MKFSIGTCPKCNKRKLLMYSNNPLSGNTICFDCINEQLDYNNIEHAEFFCRTYNLPWQPELWLDLSMSCGEKVFQEYTSLLLDDKANQPNLAYSSSTKDL